MVLAHCGSLLLDPAALQEVGCLQTYLWQCGLMPNVQCLCDPI